MSVIVPVYNSADFLDACVSSLDRQTIGGANLEIILVNDGSTDSSGEKCKELAKASKNIVYISKENGGVSSARNAGIEAATGKYIMFLDSDDELSEDSAQKLYDFFEAHNDEVDLVTYTLVYRYVGGGPDRVHKRYTNIFTADGVYSIDENPHIAQTTMNICVKNNAETQRFDTALSMGEDQRFITETIMKKGKIGFVSGSKYIYYRYAESCSSKGGYPYYCFNSYTDFLKKLAADFSNENGVSRYVQALILYNLNWRATGDYLVDSSESIMPIEKQWEILRGIVKMIDDDIIADSIYIEPVHRAFFAKLKGEPLKLCKSNFNYALYNEKTLWFCGGKVDVVFTRFDIKESVLILQGFIKSIVNEYEPISMYTVVNNVMNEVELRSTACSYYRSTMKLNDFYGFDIEIPLKKSNTVDFRIKIGGSYFKVSPYFWPDCAVSSTKLPVVRNGYVLCYDDCITAEKKNAFRRVLSCMERNNRVASQSMGAFGYRVASGKRSKPIWLYCDRKGVFDNAYYQFKHDIKKNDGIKRYYVTDGITKEEMKLFEPGERKRLVKFQSYKNKILFLNCSKVLTSFTSKSTYSPFGAGPLTRWYSDITTYELIYLQHGILHAHLPMLYAKDRSGVDKIVVSSGFEIKNYVENYNYKQSDLIPSGMSRYDTMNIAAPQKRKIIFVPSWRRNLIGEFVNNQRKSMPEVFKASDFYIRTNEFLNSPELHSLLERCDLELDFKNHPIFRDYDELFSCSSNRVNIVKGEIELDDYCLMITDYSSIVFDFVYLEKPIVYFVPDYDLFRTGVSHTYKKMDLPLEDGFGAFTKTSDELIEQIGILAENDFKTEEKYKSKYDGFFLEKGNHCERLYNELMK